MSNLSPLAQRLVRAGAHAARPADADQSRIFEALRHRLGDAAMIEGASTAAAQGTAGALWVKVSALTVGLGLFAGALAVVSSPTAPAPTQAASPPVALAAPAVAPISTAAAESAPQSPVAAPAPTEASVGQVRRPADRLTQEVALLSRATSDLRTGRAAEALKVLDEHRRQFPSGVLSEERRAARAQALCALGRRGEAEAELARLAKTSPQSMQAARARQVCGIR
jgi:hypothetical protein